MREEVFFFEINSETEKLLSSLAHTLFIRGTRLSSLSLSLSLSVASFSRAEKRALSSSPRTHGCTLTATAMEPPEYGSDDLEARGLHSALATVCALEQRLRSAIQASVPISRSLELDPDDADREREALLSTR